MHHSGPISDMEALPRSEEGFTRFATCSADKTIRFWHFISQNGVKKKKPVVRNPFCDDLRKIVYVSADFAHFKSASPDQEEKGVQLYL